MINEPKIALDCPSCGESLYAPLGWFKQACLTCPRCSGQLSGAQFAEIVLALELAMAEAVEERVSEPPETDRCGKHSSCCGKPV